MKDNKFLHFLKTEMRTQKTTWLIYTAILAVLCAALISIVALAVEVPDELTELACDMTNQITVESTDPDVFRTLENCPVVMEFTNLCYVDIEGLLLQEEDILKIMGREDLIGPLTDDAWTDAGNEAEGNNTDSVEADGIEGFMIPMPDTFIMLNIDPEDYLIDYINISVTEGDPYTKDCNHELYLWISKDVAEYRGLHTGDVVTVPYNVYSGKKVSIENMDCVIKGILGDEASLIFPIQCVMTYEVGRRIQGPVPFRATVRVKSILQYNNIVTKLRKAGGMVYFAYDPEMTENDSITGYIYIIYALYGVCFLVLLMLVSVLVMLVRMYVSKRTRFFAMLRTAGMSGKDCSHLTLFLFVTSLTAAFAVGFGLSPVIVSLVNDVFNEQFIMCSLSASPFALRNLGLFVCLLTFAAGIVWILTAKNRRSEIVDGLRREL